MDLIALTDKNWAIGFMGEQIIYIPEDLKRFKELTMGKALIFGRRTLYTFPNKKPLEGRKNLILSKNKDLRIEGGSVFNSIEQLLAAAPEDSFVIGGEMVYNRLLEFCQRAYITYLDAEFKADCFLANLDEQPDWRLSDESEQMEFNKIKYTFRLYERIAPFKTL